jgi:hypothetical protein
MHIKEAKKQIRSAVIAYSAKDETGRLRIPVQAQRPVFLIGAPGIGKTAIVEQIAKEMEIGFVSYAMTHHTRQSALGLPYIVEKEFGGKKYSVSEYTMSEIIASVYEEMKKTGKSQGILFLDEINCVSETLAPSMLQFLQYKTFGRHSVPEGWIVVTAGNPPAYNDSVREFDIAMLDRLKKIEVEPDFEVWKEFAAAEGVHPSVLSYLAIKPQYFYRVSVTIDGKSFVTARGWDDLSKMITIYEENDLPVDRSLIGQYIQDEQIASDFANYYDLFRKYRSDYQVGAILEGKASKEIAARAGAAGFDERLSLISLLLDSLQEQISSFLSHEDCLKTVISEIRAMETANEETLKEKQAEWKEKTFREDTKENLLLAASAAKLYEKLAKAASGDPQNAKKELQSCLAQVKAENQAAESSLENVFVFMENAFGNGQEIVILVSEMTIRPDLSRYLYLHGCDKYDEYSDRLLFEDRKSALSERIDALKLPEAEEL